MIGSGGTLDPPRRARKEPATSSSGRVKLRARHNKETTSARLPYTKTAMLDNERFNHPEVKEQMKVATSVVTSQRDFYFNDPTTAALSPTILNRGWLALQRQGHTDFSHIRSVKVCDVLSSP